MNKQFRVKECEVCKKTCALKRCGGCNSVRYCSKEHKTFHWKHGHKAVCAEMGREMETHLLARHNAYMDDVLR